MAHIPSNATILHYGYCCAYGVKDRAKEAASGSDKVWAIYRHPTSRKNYTL